MALIIKRRIFFRDTFFDCDANRLTQECVVVVVVVQYQRFAPFVRILQSCHISHLYALLCRFFANEGGIFAPTIGS